MGTVSNCTFTNMGKCVSGMDTVTNCIFDGCSYAVDECCYKVKESRFYNCALACQKLFGQAVVSNCQFVNCKGEELITSGLNAEVKVEDCEFSNIRLVEDGFTYYFRSMIVLEPLTRNLPMLDAGAKLIGAYLMASAFLERVTVLPKVMNTHM